MQRGLFFQQRDLTLLKSLSEQLVEEWMKVEFQYFKLNTKNIKVNIYGQARRGARQYYKGITMPGLIDHNPQALDFSQSLKYRNSARFRLLVQTLKKYNLYPEVGDIVYWNKIFWQIANVTQQQLIANDHETKWSKILQTVTLSDSKVKQLLKFSNEEYNRYTEESTMNG